jgi:hypothetical protein
MKLSMLADGLFDRNEAIIRFAVLLIVPVAFAAIGLAFFALTKIRKK